jgi:hypothetical protein
MSVEFKIKIDPDKLSSDDFTGALRTLANAGYKEAALFLAINKSGNIYIQDVSDVLSNFMKREKSHLKPKN